MQRHYADVILNLFQNLITESCKKTKDTDPDSNPDIIVFGTNFSTLIL